MRYVIRIIYQIFASASTAFGRFVILHICCAFFTEILFQFDNGYTRLALAIAAKAERFHCFVSL